MDKENQIKGIVEVLRHLCENECFRTEDGFIDCDACEACYLYEAGYRRQIEGRWITPTTIGGRAFSVPHCSVCNGIPCGVDENTKYCPNCGAKMRRDEKNG